MPTTTAQDKTDSSSFANERNIADILLESKALSQEAYEQVKLEHLNTGKSLESIIREKGLVSEPQIVEARGLLYNIPYCNLAEVPSSPEALGFLSQNLAQKFSAIPISYSKKENTLSLAMSNPLDLEAIEFIEGKTGAQVTPFIAPAEDVEKAIAERYKISLATEVTAAMKETGASEAQTVDITKLGEVIKEAPIAKIVSTILEFAMRSRASDIHLEPQEERTRVRYRIDGILHEKLVLPKSVHEALVSRIKILSGIKIDEKRIPQDGRFNFKAAGEEVDLRVSTLPTAHGEKVVMRLLKKSGGVPTLPELGLRGRALHNLEEAILRPHGIITVCGPTGSGKTTTLYSVLSKINTTKVNIVTLEDPIEYKIAGVNQVQVNPAAGLTFASGLRAFLRQDPNIIMVGEIRDSETTDLAIQASLTGHLVFSTLHTNDASGALPRLLDMGAEPFLLASSMTAILAQRISRRICPDCRKEYKPPEETASDIRKVLGSLWPSDKPIKLWKGEGCDRCNNTGYLGRIGIFEVLPVTEKVAHLILERQPASAIEKQAIEEGMITMKQDGYLKVLEGITSIEEVLRVAQE